MAKLSMKSANMTSFHNVTITCTAKELIAALGDAQYINNDGSDKSNFDWVCETASGKVFTIYDWKHYRSIDLNEKINWHIGSHEAITSLIAKDELMAQIIKNKLQNA
jgi:hypothetical protein